MNIKCKCGHKISPRAFYGQCKCGRVYTYHDGRTHDINGERPPHIPQDAWDEFKRFAKERSS